MSNNDKIVTLNNAIKLLATVFVIAAFVSTFGARLVSVEVKAEDNKQSNKSLADAHSEGVKKNETQHKEIRCEMNGQFKSLQEDTKRIEINQREFETKQDIVMDNQKVILQEIKKIK